MGALCTAHFAQSSRLITEHGGYEIKTIGDSVMGAFRTVDNALDYACALHRDPGGATLPGAAQLQIRAGIHIGPVSVEKGRCVRPDRELRRARDRGDHRIGNLGQRTGQGRH